MIDFSALKGLTIPEGVVTKIECGGAVLWKLQSGGKSAILEVEKASCNGYCVLLDIYPKSGGTVNITYGGLTKTIVDDGTSENPNAVQVYFGTHNSVTDEVETPSSGTLTIEGDYAAYAVGTWSATSGKSTTTNYFSGVTAIVDFGSINYIPAYAFTGNRAIEEIEFPNGIDSIGNSAFSGCQWLQFSEIPEGVKTIGDDCFRKTETDGTVNPYDKPKWIPTLILPSTLESIGNYAFVVYASSSGSYQSLAGEIVCKAKIPPTLGSYVFGQFATVDITVPSGCGEAYKAADGWSLYADYITEADE